ncbi:MAG TPA: DUF3806 domain-containing protein [Fluviicoccus sp.]|nr:DUF3806 domain-containing protein [Fluviicoccus sp.]
MEPRIDAPGARDLVHIGSLLGDADKLARERCGATLDGSLRDLSRLQQVLDSGALHRDDAYPLQILGMAFGRLFVNENPQYDWWMVEDAEGREPAVRYQESSLLLFPQTMISKRLESDGRVDVAHFYDELLEELETLIAENV